MIITGIGSRQTPDHIQCVMRAIGELARAHNWYVRSGHADGADYAFEQGARRNCIVYLPWEGFNYQRPVVGNPIIVEDVNPEALKLVVKAEPYAANLSRAIKLIKCRNVYQVLGVNMDKPSDVVICWTKDAQVVGGTGLAMKIASDRNIPIINLALGTSLPTLVAEEAAQNLFTHLENTLPR
jgi:hypothetical protein